MFEARYPGRCNAECGDPVEVGDLCMYDPAEEGKIIHERCSAQLKLNLDLSGEVAKARPEKAYQFQGTTLDDMGY